MSAILIATLVLALCGVFVGVGLVFTGKKFHVEVDEKEIAVRECLPGNNCGACGFAGCDALAAAIAKGDAPVSSCPVGGASAAAAIGEIMGTEAGDVERKIAFVRCKGTCEVTKNQGNYIGIEDCRSVVFAALNYPECSYGCLGLGSCVKVCPQNAISIVDGCAVVDRSKCVGCGLCAKTCPKGLIELIPEDKVVAVQCSNRDRGPTVKKICLAGCIGCTLCTRQCEYEAIHMDGNVARVDYEKCVQCGKCAEKCPQKVIVPPVA